MKTHHIDDVLTLKILALSHDGRAIARPHEEPVVFVQGALPGQTVLAKVLHTKKRMTDAICMEVIEESPHAVPCSCPHAIHASPESLTNHESHSNQTEHPSQANPMNPAGQAQNTLACGACPWMGFDYALQLQAKNQMLFDALTRIGHLPLSEILKDEIQKSELPPVISEYSEENPEVLSELGPLGYRNKMEFAFAQQNEHTALGLRAKYSHDIVEVDQCKMQSPATMKILAKIRELIKDKTLPFLRFLVIRSFRSFDETQHAQHTPHAPHMVVELITFPVGQKEQLFIKDLGNALMNLPEVQGFIYTSRKNALDIAYGEKLCLELGDTELKEYLHLAPSLAPHKEAVPFAMSHQSFFQINTKMAEKLYAYVYELIQNLSPNTQDTPNTPSTQSKPTIWDIYCGVGCFGILTAPLASQIFGLETVPSAIECAQKNAKHLNNCKFVTRSASIVSKYFKQGMPDIVILDPPRAGLDTSTLEALCTYKPRHIIMISCNATTLARDLSKLHAHYHIKDIQAFDLFPHTPHMEIVVNMLRA